MKRIFTILLFLATLAGIADAQISIKKKDTGKAKQMATLSMSWSWIYQADGAYYLVMKSDNQFDDSFWLKMGSTKEECLESVTSLLDLANTIGETDRFDINNGEGEIFDTTQYKAMGMKGLKFHGKGYAGTAFILTTNLTKAHKWIQKNIK